jgi:hypothetical protein
VLGRIAAKNKGAHFELDSEEVTVDGDGRVRRIVTTRIRHSAK